MEATIIMIKANHFFISLNCLYFLTKLCLEKKNTAKYNYYYILYNFIKLLFYGDLSFYSQVPVHTLPSRMQWMTETT